MTFDMKLLLTLHCSAPSHIKALEGEVRLLKVTCGHLHEQLEGTTRGPSVAPSTHTPVEHLQLQNNTLKQGHSNFT